MGIKGDTMENIVVCIDGSDYTEAVVDMGVWAAKALSAPLLLLHAHEKSIEGPQEVELSGKIGMQEQENLLASLVDSEAKQAKQDIQQGKKLLQEVADVLLARGVQSNILQKHGDLLENLVDMQSTIRILLVGKAGKATKEAVGTHMEGILRTIKAPVLIVNEKFVIPQSYMLAFDGSEVSCRLVERVMNTPLLKGMDCHLVMVEGSDDKKILFANAKQQLESQGVNVLPVLLNGDVADTLLSYQKENDVGLMVMGAYGHSKLRQFFLGSTTTKVIAGTTVPLVVLA